MSGDILQLPFGDTILEFRLKRRDRKTLSISVLPDLSIEAIAPMDAPQEKIVEKVRKRAPWIQKQIRYFAQFQPRTPERRFIAGETHLYLGRQYKLKVVPHIQEQVKLYRGCIVVRSLRPRQDEVTKALLQAWYRERAHVKFRERLGICQQKFPDPEAFEPSGLVVRQLQQRWGSMTPGRRLILNRSLIKASVDAIDYVITHELCHIRYDHHRPAFYQLLDRVMPDWERRKIKLERQLA